MTPAGDNLDAQDLASESAIAAKFCLALIRSAQNADGGWGFQPGLQSRVEPTCWAILALRAHESTAPAGEIRARGLEFIRKAQLANGSWPASADASSGSWVTVLACWVLAADARARGAVTAGVKWICNDWPRDRSTWRRWHARLFSHREITEQNDSYRGWGWTPHTSSWVEPTSFALIMLASTPVELLPKGAARRRELARSMLYDRMCPGGGWNCGNPMVYGVAGEPLIVPTVWALLALRDEPKRPEFVMSLDWLENNIGNARGAGSLALARIGVEVGGRKWPPSAPTIRQMYGRNEFLQNIAVASWACLASCPRHEWLTGAAAEFR
jgi:hypothetical protein